MIEVNSITMKLPKKEKISLDDDFVNLDDPKVYIKEVLRTTGQPKFFFYQNHLNEFLK